MAEHDKILLAHGSGGKMAHELIIGSFIRELSNPLLAKMDDSAVVHFSGKLAFTRSIWIRH